jgi:hypothetical protein
MEMKLTVLKLAMTAVTSVNMMTFTVAMVVVMIYVKTGIIIIIIYGFFHFCGLSLYKALSTPLSCPHNI